MTSLITGLEEITETVKECIRSENVSGGLLEDVEDIITVYNNEDGVEEPAVWMVQHPTVAVKNVEQLHTAVFRDHTCRLFSGHAVLLFYFKIRCISYICKDLLIVIK